MYINSNSKNNLYFELETSDITVYFNTYNYIKIAIVD